MESVPVSIKDSIKVENVVTSADLGKNLELEAVSEDIEQAKFNRDQFPGLIYRTVDPKATILVFRSGKIVCTGSTSYDESQTALAELQDRFDEIGIEYPELDGNIQNIVGVADLGDRLNLNAIAIGLGLERTEYEPEQFPGLIYRMDDLPTVGLLFGSGKMVITGGKHRDDVEKGVVHTYQQLQNLHLI